MKFTQISSGFRDINHWGTVEESSDLLNRCPNATDQVLTVYGMNWIVPSTYNWRGIGDHPYQPRLDLRLFEPNDTKTDCIITGTYPCAHFDGYMDKWFGIEFKYNRGTVEKDDGKVSVWFYDSTGKEELMYENNNFQLMKSYDHKWNKFVLGGNHIVMECDYNLLNTIDSDCYYDDVIINGSRIGPKYFFLKFRGVQINNGDETTAVRQVTLNFNAPENTTKMRISNDGINLEPEENFIHTKPWQLEEGEGEKKVYVQYYTDGVWSEPFSDTILYELSNLCDINADGQVSVQDVQLCVNVILGIIADPENKADVNGDKEVNVSDVQAVVNAVLGGE